MNTLVPSHGSTSRRSRAAAKLATMFVLGVASIALIGSITPADARKGGSQGGGQYRAAPANLTPPPPVVRGHRTGPVVRDHRAGAPGSRKRKVPCLGNMCGIKVCAASVCF